MKKKVFEDIKKINPKIPCETKDKIASFMSQQINRPLTEPSSGSPLMMP